MRLSDLLPVFLVPFNSAYPKLLVQQIASCFQTRWVVLIRLSETQVPHLEAAWEHDHWITDSEITANAILWTKVIEEKTLIVEQGLRLQFSDAGFFIQKQIEGFAGILLENSSGKKTGILSVLDPQPLRFTSDAIDALRMAALHVASQMELACLRQITAYPGNQVVSGMSHELKSPLNSILGFSELLRQMFQNKTFDGAFEENLKVLTHSSHTLKEVIDNITDLTKFDPGGAIAEQTFDAGIVIKGIVSLFKKLFQKKRVILSYSFSTKTPLVITTDRGRLNQIFIHLLNTLETVVPPHGELKLRIALKENELCAGFQDTAKVLPAREYRGRLLALISENDSEDGEHDFLPSSLSLARRLIQSVGGTLSIESEEEHVILECRIPLSGVTSLPLPIQAKKEEKPGRPLGPSIPENPDLSRRLKEIQGLSFWRYTLIEEKIGALMEMTARDEMTQKKLQTLAQSLSQMNQVAFEKQLTALIAQLNHDKSLP